MKTLLRLAFVSTGFFLPAGLVFAQLYKVELDEKISKSTVIIEGKVIDKKSFWNDEHTMIYTANTVEVYKIFKGELNEATVEVMTQGGAVGTDYVEASHLLTLEKGKTGIFFCEPNGSNIKSPVTKKILMDVYSSDQGFLRYNLKRNSASAPFAVYNNISGNLYNMIRRRTGREMRIVNPRFKASSLSAESADMGTAGTLATISSFSPAIVHGGTLNDPANNTLTINGSGFGSVPSGQCAVLFKDANNDRDFPDYNIPYTSQYFVSWSDTKIVIKVPSRAATGNIAVVLSDGTSAESSSPLNIFYSVLNFEFDFSADGVDTTAISEPRLMNTNGEGGYTIQYSTSTAGGGKNFATSPAKDAFLRALTTWKEATGVNFSVGATTSAQNIGDDKANLIVFDNTNTGVPRMGAGVLEVTYSWGSTCYSNSPFRAFNAQKTGFDILVRNDGVSQGADPLIAGPCFPSSGQYDLETVLLHELGHALNLMHINDDVEGSSIPNINPEKLMHYAISNYIVRRSLDNSAYEGALYTVQNQNNTYGSCNLFSGEMTLLPYTVLPNDNCPASFPPNAIADGTIVSFDLVHATSNMSSDPPYTAVNCNNTGANVTNNAYYAFRTSSSNQGNLGITISNYTTVPAELAACEGQGIRMAIYDVNACPAGQQYPQPVACRSFNADGVVNTVTRLQANHTYLLYFDGIRNTKASFDVTFSGNGEGNGNPPPSTGTISFYPNPTRNFVNIDMTGMNPGNYNFLVYDMLGRLFISQPRQLSGNTQGIKLPLTQVASGVYIIKIVDPDGKVVSRQKVIKE